MVCMEFTMKKHVLSLTYEPKVIPVLTGKCHQTIRLGRQFKKGDLIMFHGWAGLPYRSPWSFRTPYYCIKEVVDIEITPDCMIDLKTFAGMSWESPEMDEIARLDGIDPPTGVELFRVLSRLNKIPDTGVAGQIIRFA